MKRIINLVFLSAMSVLCFSCATHKYGLKFFDDAENMLDSEFISKQNLREFTNETETPTDRTFVVDTESLYHSYFNDDESYFALNYEKEKIVIFTFACGYRRHFFAKSVSYKNKTLSVKCEMKRSLTDVGRGFACQPYQRWFIIKVDIAGDIDQAIVKVKQ